MEGKSIMVSVDAQATDTVTLPTFEFDCRVLKFRKFLPKGKTSDGGFRSEDLIQLYTDPGGIRTLAVSSIRIGRRRRNANSNSNKQQEET